MSHIKFDWFIPALLGAILLAKVWPEAGIGTGPFSVKVLSGYGVSVIFLLYGFRLNFKSVIKSIWNWKLHVIIQVSTFIIFPIIALVMQFIMGDNSDLWKGVIFLSIMPSTVSSAAVLVSMANGNVPAALFNSSLSSILGILLPPLMLSIISGSHGGGDFDASQVYVKLIVQILMPIILGMLLNPWVGKTANKYRSFTRYFDQLVIVSIVYYSFSNSFYIDQFSSISFADLGILIVVLLILFVGINVVIWYLATRNGLSVPDLITGLFCGSTKSLVHGSTMGRLMYAGNPAVGVILLPLLVYHSMQLILSSYMVSYFLKNHRS